MSLPPTIVQAEEGNYVHNNPTESSQQPTPPPPQTEDFCYYIAKSGETRGPTHIMALDALRRVGEITDTTLIWRPGFEQWQPYNNTEPESKKRQAAEKPLTESTSVFVQGLPKNVTFERVVAYFQKCGIIKKDPVTQIERVKLYADEATGEPNGEALVIYLQPQSVDLAIDLLDSVEFEPGFTLKVSPATFEKASAPEAKKRKSERTEDRPPPKIDKRIKQVLKKQEQLALSWSDGDGPTKDSALCIVVLKNMFDPQQLLDGGQVGFSLIPRLLSLVFRRPSDKFGIVYRPETQAAVEELGRDIDEGLESVDGEVKKVTVFKRHPQGL